MKTLIIYYSRSGETEKIAEYIAKKLNCESVRLKTAEKYNGVFGYIKACFACIPGKKFNLLPLNTNSGIEEYERIFICAPVWVEGVCPVVKQFAVDYKNKITAELCFVISHMSDIPYSKKIAETCALFGKKIRGIVSLQTKKHNWQPEVDEFLNTINQ